MLTEPEHCALMVYPVTCAPTQRSKIKKSWTSSIVWPSKLISKPLTFLHYNTSIKIDRTYKKGPSR